MQSRRRPFRGFCRLLGSQRELLNSIQLFFQRDHLGNDTLLRESQGSGHDPCSAFRKLPPELPDPPCPVARPSPSRVLGCDLEKLAALADPLGHTAPQLQSLHLDKRELSEVQC